MQTSSKPLIGKTILVTRPEAQADELCNALELAGANTIRIPLIRITEPLSWEDFDSAAKDMECFAWVIFASTNAVDSSIQRMHKLKIGFPKHTKIACIGASTKDALLKYGIDCDFIPEKFVAESFVQQFPAPSDKEGSKNILWPRTNIGRMLIKDVLEKMGWTVKTVEAYNTSGPEEIEKTGKQIQQLLNSNQIDAITLASSETVGQLLRALLSVNAEVSKAFGKVKLIAIGSSTEKTCHSLIGKCDAVANTFNTAGLVEAAKKVLN